MKVAFVANTGWNIYNFRKGLVHHFISKGDEVLVLSPFDEYVYPLEGWGVRFISTPLDGTGGNAGRDLSYLKNLYEVFKKERPDVILSYTIKSNIYSCLAARMFKIPVICNVSGLGTVFLIRGLVGHIALALYRVAFRYASIVFFQNNDDRNLFISKIPLPEKKVGVLSGSGINLDDFAYCEPKLSDQFKFLMISRLIIEKGVREYAEAASCFENDPRVSFTLVGKLDEEHARSIDRAALDEWITRGWINYLPHSDRVKELIQESDVIVLPSYREGTPRTLLEGAAIGRALLASNVAGCKEVVSDGYNGFLFEVQNAKSLVDKIKLYMSLNPEERLKLAKNSRRLVEEKYDEKAVIEAYQKAIHRICP